ncbi:MAG TPA: Gmad2 immunoglobulin-like domain-containing protein [Gaiellaceae bacterium]
MTRWTLLSATALLVCVASGCGTTHHTVTTPSTTTAAAQMHLTIFRVTNGVLEAQDVAVPQTQGVAGAALEALGIDGSVTIANGSATVTDDGATDQQVAEIVYTLTQFSAVERVDVAGKTGLTRVDEALYVPPILLESPVGPNPLPTTFHVKGTASVFEGTLVLTLKMNNGKTIRQTVTATAGAPDLGTFDATVHATANGPATLSLYAPSAQNGKPQHEVSEQLHIGS